MGKKKGGWAKTENVSSRLQFVVLKDKLRHSNSVRSLNKSIRLWRHPVEQMSGSSEELYEMKDFYRQQAQDVTGGKKAEWLLLFLRGWQGLWADYRAISDRSV